MMRVWICVVLLAGAAFGHGDASCADGGERAFKVGGARLSIQVPAQAQIRSGAHPSGAIVVDFRPGHRQPQTITLWPAPAAAPKGHRSRTLASGARLLFVVSTAGGGSGGQEALLTGVLRLGGLSLGVQCRTQRELPPPDPMWCIPALGTMRIIKSE